MYAIVLLSHDAFLHGQLVVFAKAGGWGVPITCPRARCEHLDAFLYVRMDGTAPLERKISSKPIFSSKHGG